MLFPNSDDILSTLSKAMDRPRRYSSSTRSRLRVFVWIITPRYTGTGVSLLWLLGRLYGTGALATACTTVELQELGNCKCRSWYRWVAWLFMDTGAIQDHRNQCNEWIWHWLFLAEGVIKRSTDGSRHLQHVSSDYVGSSSQMNAITVGILLTCHAQGRSNILVESK